MQAAPSGGSAKACSTGSCSATVANFEKLIWRAICQRSLAVRSGKAAKTPLVMMNVVVPATATPSCTTRQIATRDGVRGARGGSPGVLGRRRRGPVARWHVQAVASAAAAGSAASGTSIVALNPGDPGCRRRRAAAP